MSALANWGEYMKNKNKLIFGLLAVIIVAVVLFFTLPTGPIASVSSASAVTYDERETLSPEQTQAVSELLSSMRASRCLRNDSITVGELELDLLTPDGPMHIIVRGNKGYAYSSSDDKLWYSISNVKELCAEVEKILK